MPTWSAAISFVHPAFLWGALALAVPIIIHLWTRRVRRRIPWAAMELLQTARTSLKPFVRVRQWLLLVLRCLAILLLVVAIARPIIRATFPKISGGGQAFLILLDDTMSMRAAEETRTRFEIAREATADAMRRLTVDRPGALLTLYRVSDPAQPLVSNLGLSSERMPEMIQRIENLEPSFAAADWVAVFNAVDDFAQVEDSPGRQLLIISDFQVADWPESVLNSLDTLAEGYDGAALLPVAAGGQSNLAITSLKPERTVAVAGRTVWFETSVLNGGEASSEAVELECGAFDGRPRRFEIPPLKADQEYSFRFALQAPDSGDLAARATLPGDAMQEDNERYAVAPLRDSLLAVIVDPPRSSAPSPGLFLSRALAPPGRYPSGIEARRVKARDFSPSHLEEADVVVLPDLSTVSGQMLTVVKDYARRGGGLIVFMSETAQATHLRDWPIKLARITESVDEPATVATTGSLLNLGPEYASLVDNLRAARWAVLETGDGVEIRARFSPSGNPAWLSATVGEGHLEVCATAVDTEWNNWPSQPAFVLMLQEAVMRSAGPSGVGRRNIMVGEQARVVIDPRRTESRASWQSPAEGPITQLQARSAERDLAFVTPKVETPGLGRLQLRGHDGSKTAVRVAVGTPPEESRIAPISREALRNSISGRLRVLDSIDAFFADRSAGGAPLWRWALMAMLLVLLVESVVALRRDEGGKGAAR